MRTTGGAMGLTGTGGMAHCSDSDENGLVDAELVACVGASRICETKVSNEHETRDTVRNPRSIGQSPSIC